MNENIIHIIEPYRKHGTWVFDDEKVGLKEEPFVFGVPQIIDRVVNDSECQRCRFIFSGVEMPEYNLLLEKVKGMPDMIGTWYECKKMGMKGWLCPALGLYFRSPPEKIYIKIEKIEE